MSLAGLDEIRSSQQAVCNYQKIMILCKQTDYVCVNYFGPQPNKFYFIHWATLPDNWALSTLLPHSRKQASAFLWSGVDLI